MYWLTGFLGLLLGAAPFAFNYADNPAALWTSVIIGATVVVASIFEAAEADKDPIEYWLAGILGLVALGAPFAFSYGHINAALWSSVIVGAAIVIVSAGRLLARDMPGYG